MNRVPPTAPSKKQEVHVAEIFFKRTPRVCVCVYATDRVIKKRKKKKNMEIKEWTVEMKSVSCP